MLVGEQLCQALFWRNRFEGTEINVTWKWSAFEIGSDWNLCHKMGLMMDALKSVSVAQVAIKPLNAIVLCVTITNTWAKRRGWLQSGLWTQWSAIQIEILMVVDLRKHYFHSDKIIIIIILIIMQKQASILELFSSFGALITNTKCSFSVLTQRLLVLRGTFT